MPLPEDIKKPPLLLDRPAVWDGFGFHKDRETQEIVFYYFDDVAKEYGQLPSTVPAVDGREMYHVVLTSVRKGKIHLEHPFTSTFSDAFTYARDIAHSGFTGVMIRENMYSLAILARTFLEIMTHHASQDGFWLDDEQGVPVFYQGVKIPEGTK